MLTRFHGSSNCCVAGGHDDRLPGPRGDAISGSPERVANSAMRDAAAAHRARPGRATASASASITPIGASISPVTVSTSSAVGGTALGRVDVQRLDAERARPAGRRSSRRPARWSAARPARPRSSAASRSGPRSSSDDDAQRAGAVREVADRREQDVVGGRARRVTPRASGPCGRPSGSRCGCASRGGPRRRLRLRRRRVGACGSAPASRLLLVGVGQLAQLRRRRSRGRWRSPTRLGG